MGDTVKPLKSQRLPSLCVFIMQCLAHCMDYKLAPEKLSTLKLLFASWGHRFSLLGNCLKIDSPWCTVLQELNITMRVFQTSPQSCRQDFTAEEYNSDVFVYYRFGFLFHRKLSGLLLAVCECNLGIFYYWTILVIRSFSFSVSQEISLLTMSLFVPLYLY